MAVWPDGTYQLLHYSIAEGEDSQSWLNFFTHLIERGLDPQAVKLIVSDDPRIRTSNLLERLFEEFRRKADEIGAFPNQMSCLTLFFLVVQRDHAKHNRPFF